MSNKKSEFRIYAEWSKYEQSDLEKISKRINQTIESMKSKRLLGTVNNAEVGEEFDEKSFEHHLNLADGSTLRVVKVEGPLQKLGKANGIRRIMITLSAKKNVGLTSTIASRILYKSLRAISKKMEGLKKTEAEILAEVG